MMGTMAVRLVTLLAATAGLAALAGAPAAVAQAPTAPTMSIGVPDGTGIPPSYSLACSAPCVTAQLSGPINASYTAPVYGTITSWSATISGSGSAALVTLRPTGSGTYTVATTSTLQPVGPIATQYFFATSQAVQPGDMIGLETTGGAQAMTLTATDGSSAGQGDGAVQPFSLVSTAASQILQVNAIITRTPSITGVAPASGPTAGGTAVAITGQNLDLTSAVLFGTTPAASFTINGFSSITAIAPAGVPATIDVTVVGQGGTSTTSASDQFTFQGPAAPAAPPAAPPSTPSAPAAKPRCKVPNLLNHSYQYAKELLYKGHCSVGSVTVASRSSRRVVLKQSPIGGRTLSYKGRVSMTLGLKG
jgi:hypothetical protein